MAVENPRMDEKRILEEGGILVTPETITPEIQAMLDAAGTTLDDLEGPIYLADVSPEWEAEFRRKLQQNKLGEVLPEFQEGEK